jgi:solute carrier family 25 protein 16
VHAFFLEAPYLTSPSPSQAKTTTAPLERVKILFQVATIHYPFKGVVPTLRRIVEREGFRGLYKGNVSSLVRIFPYAATQFAAFDIFKAALTPKDAGISGLANFLAGAGAGATAVAFTYPLDVTRARLAVQVPRTSHSPSRSICFLID